MVRAVREIRAAPLSGAPIDLAVVTGDATDNCQRNELRSYIDLLDGGRVLPDSGDPQRYEGVAGPEVEDERYWHPDGGEPDLPRSRYGFPGVPGVLTAMRRPFRTPGIGVPWYAVHGNHDNMLQGTVPAEGWLHDYPVGAVKYVTPPDGIDAADALRRFDTSDPAALAELAGGPRLAVTPDPARVPVTRASHVREHFRTSGRPVGHGYTRRNADEGTAYYGFDHGIVRCLMLDTVNPHGGWQGSIDDAQLGWLAGELTACAARPVLLLQPPSAGDAGERPAPARRRPARAGRRAPRPAARPPVRGGLGERAHPRARGHRDPRRRIPGRVLAGDHRVAHRLAAAGQDHRAARDRRRPGDRVHRDRQRGPGQLPRRREPRRPGQPGGAGPRARRQRLAGPGAHHGRRRCGRRHRGGPERRARGRVAAASPVTRRSRGPAGTARAAGARRSGRRSGRAGWSRRR